ncbi:MAG: TAT-variant-translocated molybdopterin oxidoreductase, partial [Polyangiaceae bacterium]
MYAGLYENETSRLCEWFVPQAHYLEVWGDALAFDGSPSIAQPLMTPLSPVKSEAQVLAALVGEAEATSRELVEATWRARRTDSDFDGFWQRTLVHGIVDGAGAPAVAVTINWATLASVLATAAPPRAELEIVYFADAKVHDGRFAHNAWLQELADPVTKLTWDNAALLSPATASRLNLRSEDVVAIEVGGRSMDAPVLVVPGMSDDVVAIALGYGQANDGLSSGVGANAYALRSPRAPWFDDAVVHKTGHTWPLAITQGHWSMEDRPIVLSRTLDQYRSDPGFAKPYDESPPALYNLVPGGQHQWGMTIDLN